nr:unnamed protein product [Callosobruchus chinensis]
MYRKKRPDASWLRDNLKLEKGSFKFLKTEYMRRFKNFYELLKAKNEIQPVKFTTYPIKPLATLQLEGDQEFDSNYKESYGKQWLPGLDNLHMDYETSHSDSQTAPDNPLEYGRQPPRRRPTILKLEGDHYYFTEYTDRFTKYEIWKRAELLRTPTHLKLEGEMEDKTENRETFVKYDHVERPPLCKKFTQLHLEGSFDFSTDNMRSYPLHGYQQRPSLVRKSTNLNLEGDLALTPEYRREYVEYASPDRPKPIIPRNNLKTSGLFDSTIPEEKFSTKLQPLIPFLREPSESRGGSRPTSRTSSRRGSFKEDRYIPTYVSKVIFRCV